MLYTIVVTTCMSIIKNYYVNHLLWIVFIAIYAFLFRLGDEYYKVFTECVQLLASEDLYENPNSLESKKHQAFMSAQACADMAKNMSAKMTKCNDVDVMGKINKALRCMWDLMSQYRNTISYTHIGCLFLQQQKFQPLLLNSSRLTAMHYLSILKFSADMCCVSISKLLTFRTYIKAFG